MPSKFLMDFIDWCHLYTTYLQKSSCAIILLLLLRLNASLHTVRFHQFWIIFQTWTDLIKSSITEAGWSEKNNRITSKIALISQFLEIFQPFFLPVDLTQTTTNIVSEENILQNWTVCSIIRSIILCGIWSWLDNSSMELSNLTIATLIASI